jgi:nucleotide-binding universal stress UspA family protein
MAYQKILVPLDGSDLAEKALPYTKAIAKLKNSEVILFAVSITPEGYRRDRLLKSYLDVNAKELDSQGIQVTTTVAYGEVAEEIIEFADKNKVDLIIISTHGYSGIKRWMLGSITQKVLYGTCAPVLLIKSKSPQIAKIDFKKIMIPLDGSPFSETTFPYIEELAKGTETEILLLQVSESPVVPSYGLRPINPTWEKYRDDLWSELQKQAGEYLEKIKTNLENKGLQVKTQVAKEEIGEVAQSIMQIAQKEEIDLIVMAAHGRTGVSRWVYGSVANRIVQESAEPILLIRPAIPSGPCL